MPASDTAGGDSSDEDGFTRLKLSAGQSQEADALSSWVAPIDRPTGGSGASVVSPQNSHRHCEHHPCDLRSLDTPSEGADETERCVSNTQHAVAPASVADLAVAPSDLDVRRSSHRHADSPQLHARTRGRVPRVPSFSGVFAWGRRRPARLPDTRDATGPGDTRAAPGTWAIVLARVPTRVIWRWRQRPESIGVKLSLPVGAAAGFEPLGGRPSVWRTL